MSKAEELLNTLSANSATEEHIVVGTDRFITVPVSLKRIGVQFDHNIETVTFDCPRYWDEHDLSKLIIKINYMRPDNQPGSFAATDVKVDESDESLIHFNWLISENVTEVNGKLSFLVCASKTDDSGDKTQAWHSELNSDMYISAGMECDSTIAELYPDVITQILTKLDNLDLSEDKIATLVGDYLEKHPAVSVDTVPTKDSANPVASGGVYERLQPYVATFSYDGDGNIICDRTIVEITEANKSNKWIVGKLIGSDITITGNLSTCDGTDVSFRFWDNYDLQLVSVIYWNPEDSKWESLDVVFAMDDSSSNSFVLYSSNVVDDLVSPEINTPLSANQGKVLKGLVDKKVNITDIADDLNTNDGNKPLSAYQGVVLNDKIEKVVSDAQKKYLPLSGGTLTGNLEGKYITGTRLQATADAHLQVPADKIFVKDAQGWLYYRTLDEIKSDVGSLPNPNSLSLTVGNNDPITYDGSEAATIDISDLNVIPRINTNKNTDFAKAVCTIAANHRLGFVYGANYTEYLVVTNYKNYDKGQVLISDNETGFKLYSFDLSSNTIKLSEDVIRNPNPKTLVITKDSTNTYYDGSEDAQIDVSSDDLWVSVGQSSGLYNVNETFETMMDTNGDININFNDCWGKAISFSDDAIVCSVRTSPTTIAFITINSDNTVNVAERYLGEFVVNVTVSDGTYSCDTTTEEIYKIYQNGGMPVLIYNDLYVAQLSQITESDVYFTGFANISNDGVYIYWIYNSNEVTVMERTVVNSTVVVTDLDGIDFRNPTWYPVSAVTVRDALRDIKKSIPTVPDSLKNPNALTFTGAATGSYDGSEAVEINIPSGEKEWTLVVDTTIEEEVVNFSTNIMADGSAISEHDISEVVFEITLNHNSEGKISSYNRIDFLDSDGAVASYQKNWGIDATADKRYLGYMRRVGKTLDGQMYADNGNLNMVAGITRAEYFTNSIPQENPISTIKIVNWTAMGIGSKILIYAR